MHAVQEFDYAELVVKMADVGMTGMAEVIAGTLSTLPRPEWENERTYFWTALFNAARANDGVWLWLCAQPHIRHFAPKTSFVHPQMVNDMELPEIGGSEDKRLDETEIEPPKQWPVEPIEENFLTQAEALDQEIKIQTAICPERASVTTIQEYVAGWYHSGTGRMMAQVQLAELGLHALATPEGIDFLREAYPPA